MTLCKTCETQKALQALILKGLQGFFHFRTVKDGIIGCPGSVFNEQLVKIKHRLAFTNNLPALDRKCYNARINGLCLY